MMKRRFTVVLGIVLLSVLFSGCGQKTINDAIPAVFGKVVDIICYTPDIDDQFGAGFLVEFKGEAAILTNAHIITHTDILYENIVCHFNNEKQSYHMICENYDTELDLALLHFPETIDKEVFTFADSDQIRYGQPVATIGNPDSYGLAASTGIISGNRMNFNEKNCIQTDIIVTGGNSGGPLFDIEGNVLGIISYRVDPNISFAISSNTIKQYLENAARSTSRRVTSSRYLSFDFRGR